MPGLCSLFTTPKKVDAELLGRRMSVWLGVGFLIKHPN